MTKKIRISLPETEEFCAIVSSSIFDINLVALEQKLDKLFDSKKS